MFLSYLFRVKEALEPKNPFADTDGSRKLRIKDGLTGKDFLAAATKGGRPGPRTLRAAFLDTAILFGYKKIKRKSNILTVAEANGILPCGRVRMRTRIGIILALVTLLSMAVPWARAEETVVRRANGVVTATNTASLPNTIVVKAKTWKGADLIIGASLDSGTVLERGGRKVSLGEIKAGDRVEIVYERNSGIKARSIRVR